MASIRQALLDKLIAIGRVPPGTKPLQIRIRDKIGNNPGRILTGEKSLQDNQIYLFDNKVMDYQFLPEEEIALAEAETGSVVLMVQQWVRSTWTLTERHEILLPGSSTVRDIARGLSVLFDIPLESLRLMVVPKETEFFVSELSHKSPTRNYGRSWFDPAQERRLLRYMSHELRTQDGDLLLVQDCAEPLKELSPADLKSIRIVEAASNNASLDFWAASTADNRLASSSYGSYGTTGASNKMVNFGGGSSGGGITIKTHKDRMKEVLEMKAMNSNNSDGSETSADGGAAAGEAMVGNGYEAAGAIDFSHPQQQDSLTNISSSSVGDTREFHKQGGFALFDDIL